MHIITELWKHQPGRYFFICTKSATKKFSEHCFKRERFGDIKKFLMDSSDKDIYFCPHGFNKPRRLKEHAELPTMLWADMDEVDPNKIKWKPTIAIESSPGRHVGFWLLDKAMTEQLNQRLTYAIKADRGGWDLTQVLRVPGTRNYKYHSTPKVRLLWDDGPTYKTALLETQLPKVKEVSKEKSDHHKVFKKWRHHLPYWARNELLNGKPQQGKRSDMMWKLTHALAETGMTRDEAFALLKETPWNKFKGRASEDAQITREIEKVWDDHEEGEEEEATEEKYNLLGKSLDDVEEENIDWLWYPYLARREVTILEGDPGVGKSYLAQMIAKGLCDGDRLPSVKPRAAIRGKVAYFDVENDAATVTKKRMSFNGAKNMGNFFQEAEPLSIDDPKAIKRIHIALERIRPVVIVFDTISMYIGKADTAKSTETTQALALFKELAVRYNCAVILVRHLTKGNSKEKALYRGQGNIALTGVSRIVITVAEHPEEDDMCIMSVTKLNLVKRPKALTFSIMEVPDTLTERDRSRFKWGSFVNLTSDEILSAPPKKNGDDKSMEDAVRFLERELEEGKRKVRELEVMAEKRSISSKTLARAAEQLGVKKIGVVGGQSGYWRL